MTYYRCPQCGQQEQFDVAVHTHQIIIQDQENLEEYTLLDSKVNGDILWDDDYYMACEFCDHYGTVKDYTVEEED